MIAPAMPAFNAAPPPWLVYGASVTLAALLIVLAAGLVWLVRRRLAPLQSNLEPLARQAQQAIDLLEAGGDLKGTVMRCYAAMSRVVDKERQIQRGAAVTPHEFEQQLQRAGLPSHDVHRLTQLFEDVRYGARVPGQGEEREAIACLRSIVEFCKKGTP